VEIIICREKETEKQGSLDRLEQNAERTRKEIKKEKEHRQTRIQKDRETNMKKR
jgi:hypothetical protein